MVYWIGGHAYAVCPLYASMPIGYSDPSVVFVVTIFTDHTVCQSHLLIALATTPSRKRCVLAGDFESSVCDDQ